MATLSIVNPVAEARQETKAAERIPLAARPASLEGKVVGLYWNGKQQGDHALAATRRHLERAFPGVTFREYLGDWGTNVRHSSPAQFDQIARECDAVVGTTADCGSCTSWLIRDMSQIELRGKPTVAWTASRFVEDAHWSANAFGIPDIPVLEVPECFTNNTPENIGRMVEAQMAAVLKGLTREPEPVKFRYEHVVRESASILEYRGDDLLDCFDRMNAAFVKAGWSDGMPLVPPTREKVAAMVAASGLPGEHVLGLFEPGFGVGTVEKIAANAVMAGCAPNAMPVVIAMAECILDPKARLRTFAMSTGPQAPLVMVSGPIAKEIGMNSGVCAYGPGSISQVNVAIGRTLRLIMMNVGHSYPGVSDMDTIGTPMKFGGCVAENEEKNPWEPFRVYKGFPRESSTVTVTVPYGITEVWDFRNYDPELMAEVFCSAIRNAAQVQTGLWLTASAEGHTAGAGAALNRNPILLCPDHAQVFARAGWSIRRIQEALFKGAHMPFGEVMLNKEPANFRMTHPDKQWLWDKPETKIPLFRDPDEFEIFVVGADAGRSLYHYGGGDSMTREVRRPGR